MTLTAYTGTRLADLGVQHFDDLAPLVPGLFVSMQSVGSPSINLRGIGIQTTDPRQEARISIFQDGVAISRQAGSAVELFDLERVEVLKGPQGTLFGRSASAGALSLVSRRPSAAAESELTVGSGNFGRLYAAGFANLPLVPDQWFARVAFTSEHRDGTLKNLADGSDLNSRETTAARASLRWQPQPATTIDLIGQWERDTPAGIGFKSGVIPTVRGDTDPFTAADLNRGAALGLHRTILGGTLLVKHTFGSGWTLDSITAWRRFDAHEEFDGDGSQLYLLESYDDNHARQFSQEARVTYDDHDRLAGFAGLNFSHERGRQSVGVMSDERLAWPFLSGSFRSGLIAAGVPAALANAAVPALAPFTPQASLPESFAAFAAVPSLAPLAALAGAPLAPFHGDVYQTSSDFDAIDAFADGTWRITQELELTAGARLSDEKQTSGYNARRSTTPSVLGFLFNASPNFAFAPTPGPLDDTRRVTGWAGRLQARYLVTPRISVYAGVSRGRRPPTTIISSTYSERNAEESIVNTEAGVKGRAWSDRLEWSAALFEYHYNHFETTIIDPANAAHFVLTDAGRATGRGGELALRAALARTVSAFTTYGYTDARFDATGENGQPQLYAGSTFRLTARHTAALGLAWEIPLQGYGSFTLSPRLEYKSGHFFDDDNALANGTLHQGGFSLVHVRAVWRNADARWEVAAGAHNLFGKKYLIDAGNIGEAFNIPSFNRGDPRLLTLDLTRRF